MFFEIFNANFNSTDLYERLCFIIVTQNWEAFGTHYWIKQCIQMTLGSCANANTPVQFSDISAQRFKFSGFLNASMFSGGEFDSKLFVQPQPIATSDQSGKPPTIMMNIDINLNNENIWDCQEHVNKPLADTSVETSDSSDLLSGFKNKKLMNIYKGIS
jgi:hypothetical protein